MTYAKAFDAGRRWAARHAATDGGDDCPVRAKARALHAAKRGEEYAKAWAHGVAVEFWGPPKYDANGRRIRYFES